MITILAQIENCLNSRPLCPLTEDVEDYDVLTPAHFLTGQQMIPVPEENFMSTRENLLNRWQFCTKKYQEVCLRYKTEYIHRLQQRPKWLKTNNQVKIGQLFLIKDDNKHIQQWPLGRVTEMHAGSDGLVLLSRSKQTYRFGTRFFNLTKRKSLVFLCRNRLGDM